MAATVTRTATRIDAPRSWAPARIGDVGVRIVLGAAMVVSAALSLWFSRDTTFTTDAIYLFIDSPHLDLHRVLEPYNGHLIITPRLVYPRIFDAFGAAYLPFRLLTTGTVLLTAGLFFEFAKRRIGAVAALAPTLVLLFYGSASHHMLTGNGFTVLLPLAAGIGALLALEREDRRGDTGACLLLCLATATYSVGLAFVAGAAVLILIGADRWRRTWVFLVPTLLYAAWLLWSRDTGVGINVGASTEANVDLSNLLLVPNWALNSLASVGAAMLGLNYPQFGSGWGPVVALAALAALGWRLRWGNIPRWLWATMAVPATLWVIGAAAAAPPIRAPGAERYLYPATIGVLLVAVETARGVRLGNRVMLALYGVAAISLATNIASLRDGSTWWRALATNTRADLAAVETGNGRLGPRPPADTDVPEALRVTGHRSVATGYLQAVRQFGSPAFTLSQLRSQEEPIRERVDMELADNLGIGLQPTLAPGTHCRRISDKPGAGVSFKVPRGGAVLRASIAATLTLRRFGTAFAVQVGTLAPAAPVALAVPRDAAPDPWYALTSAAPVEVCGRPGEGPTRK